MGGHKAVAISKILSRAEVFLYSDFDGEATENMGFKKIEDIQDHINEEISKNGEIKITIVPTGRFVRLRNKKI